MAPHRNISGQSGQKLDRQTLQDFFKDPRHIKISPIPWSDETFSRRSLKLHLDQSNDVNSRRQFIIKKHVNWVHISILQEKPARILDLACGPGLYTEELAKRGHTCTGIDISPAAIEYAKNNNASNTTYLCQNLLQMKLYQKYDLVLLNFGWFNTFLRTDGEELIKQIRQLLRPGGRLLLELLHTDAIIDYGEAPPQWHHAKSGIFSDSPYLFLQENFFDERENITKVIYYIITENNNVKGFQQIYQAYDEKELSTLLKELGVRELNYYKNICDEDDFDEELYFLLCRF